MVNRKISIIVPIYNVEKYLRQCIESIVNQTYKNIEIILIDDGSQDKCANIVDEYANKDERIVVIHKKNGGLADARNAGLRIATGEYIMFVDADDILVSTSSEVLLKKMEEENADYVIGNYINCYENGRLWASPIFSIDKYKTFKLDIKDYKDSFYIMSSTVCNKMFKNKFIKSLNLEFEVGIPAEDAIFTTYCFINSKKVYYIPDIIFYYRQRKSGTSISTNCNEDYFKGISKAYKLIYENFKRNNEIGFYRFFYAKSMTYILYKFIDSELLKEEQRIKVLKEMKWFYKLSKDLGVTACHYSLKLIIDKILSNKYQDAIDIGKAIAETRKFMPQELREKMSKPESEIYIVTMKD